MSLRTYVRSIPTLLLILLAGCGGGDAVNTGKVTGTVTINGQPRENVYLQFVPVGKKIRPAMGVTDANGHFEAQFLQSQSGVPLGRCIARISITDDAAQEYLPAEYNEQAEDNPDLNLEIYHDGLVFDYDVKFDGELPPVTPES